MFLLNLAIIYPIILNAAGVLGSLVFRDSLGIFFVIGNMIFGEFLNHYLKRLTKNIAPREKMFMRPNPNKNFGCGYFPEPGYNKKTWGMPSGHAQISSFAAMFWILYILDHYPLDFWSILSISVIILITFLIYISRIYLGCHNLIQILVGGMIGFTLGYVWYYFLQYWFKNKTNL